MKVWRYSPRDLVLVLIAVAQFVAMTGWALTFGKLSLVANLAAFVALSYVFYYNPIVVTHNFLHTPFFRRKSLNRLFPVLNSANLFLPQVLYKYHHLIHHQYANDPIRNGTTLDPSSTYRYGTNGQQEGYFTYSALGLFRDGTSAAYRQAIAHGQRSQFWMELAAIIVTAFVWIAIDWQWFLFAFVPTFYCGWFLALLENYYEHHRATNHDSRLADSVSYYGSLYNLLMFNEGYHQEHHLKPHLHWTRRPEVHTTWQTQLKEAGAYEAQMPPLLGFLDRVRPQALSLEAESDRQAHV
jgi:fatty acid desaturase